MGWITDAPKYSSFMVEPCAIGVGVNAYPSLAFAFANEEGEPVTAVIVGTPDSLKQIARDIIKAIEQSQKDARVYAFQLREQAKSLENTGDSEGVARLDETDV